MLSRVFSTLHRESDATPSTKTPPIALLDCLHDLGLEFRHSVWELCIAEERDSLKAVQAYLAQVAITFKILHKPDSQELERLDGRNCLILINGELVRVNESRSQPAELALILGIQENNQSASTTKPIALHAFLRNLYQADWVSECLAPVQINMRWIAISSALIHFLGLSTALFSILVYDRIIPNQAFASLWALVAGLTLCLVADYYLKKARHNLLEVTAAESDNICSQRLAKTLLSKSTEQTQQATFQQHLSAFDHLRELLTGTFILTVIDLPFVAVFMFVLFLIHPILLAVSVVALLLSSAIIIKRHHQITSEGGDLLLAKKHNQTAWYDCIEHLNTIKAHASQQPIQRLLTRTQGQARLAGAQVRTNIHESTLLCALIQQASWAGVVVTGAYLTVAGQLTVGGMIASSILAMRAFNPIQKMQSALMQAQAGQRGFQELDKLFSSIAKDLGTRSIETISSVTLEKLSYKYENGPSSSGTTLNNISLRLQTGQRVCLVGPNGSGKSTLLHVLANVYNESSGSISINGIPTNQIDQTELGRQIGLASQPVGFMQASLYQNLSMGRPWVNPSHCEKALYAVGLKKWLDEHPLGINQPILSGGKNLSTGRKALLNVCRAIASSPSLLLLDEPSSGLDSQSNADLMSCLNRLPADICAVVATHDRSLLAWATHVIMLRDGSIEFCGEAEHFVDHLNRSNKT